jgi:hypothetical protein
MVDPVYAILVLTVAAYFAQAVFLGGRNIAQLLKRTVSDTNAAFVILVTGSVTMLYLMNTSPKTYPILSPVVGVLVGFTLGRKIEKIFKY